MKNEYENGNPQKIVAWVKTLLRHKLVLIKSLIVFTLVGLGIALFSAKEYTSWTTMVPQASNPAGKLGGLSSLAAMAGFNLDMSGGEELSPSVYPQILGSVPFQIELMNTSFRFAGLDEPVSLYTYYTVHHKKGLFGILKEYTIGLPGKLAEGRNENLRNTEPYSGQPLSLTPKQEKVRKLISKKVSLNVDIKNGFLTLNASFPQAGLSAQVANQAREQLQKYITRFKINKASEQLLFIEERYGEKKAEFLTAQENLAIFRDKNKNVSSAVAATGEERLLSEYNIALTVFNELAKQLEQAKIQVKEDTPVFSIIQPATVPLKASKPQKMLILIVWFFLGMVVGLVIIFGKHYFSEMAGAWKELENRET